MCTDSSVHDNFSSKLDTLLTDEPIIDDLNNFKLFLTKSILEASDSEIPKINKSVKKSPWANDEFLSLIKARRACRDPYESKILESAIKKMRNKLKNDYFSKLANNINVVAEARKVEEEFRLCKSYTMHKHTDTNLITSEKLTEFFEDHLKEKPVHLQPEVINPELYPHILPPDDINTNSDIPTISEVHDARKTI